MSAVLAQVSPGFSDPVHGAQQTFRTLLHAMARPGSASRLPSCAVDGIEPPASAVAERPMSVGMTAVLLTLLDADTTVRLAGSLASAHALAYLRFHTGVKLIKLEEPTNFTAARAGDVDEALWGHLGLGSDEAPQAGATLLVEVDGLGEQDGARLRLRGPGIDSAHNLRVAGLSHAFWRWRAELVSQLPRGVDLVLVCGTRLAALPRTTRVALET